MQRQRERVIMALTVIGAGFGRTGTLSLKAALEQLGLGPCYHMRTAIEHPEHVPMWESAARGERVDWDRLLDGYRATVDWPGTAFYEQLMRVYPDAKVILTVRDPDRWYDSARTSIYSVVTATNSPLFRLLTLVLPPVRRFQRAQHMIDAVVWGAPSTAGSRIGSTRPRRSRSGTGASESAYRRTGCWSMRSPRVGTPCADSSTRPSRARRFRT